ncbi:hypothetical protein LX97_00426 [Nonlabens dokdonensis]|jgi:hypothetical protein|uniref:Uncharacterized protein n=2 Tax=Nonlabens dokdonensis TaxID=328515 RepID=L7W7I4_NONDD|nr:DUF6364 family protein [Nonlabens dokdonensis]AGC75741.1 hypothetical protein DDD_0614 [Nonlabens dokdonensis DSW-6]PZX43426.1 hypothetical protein LX97_00426 [Nonlabens dokdonensis]
MDAKLTLKLDKEIIELAKQYVKENGTSLSKFIEEMLRTKITEEGMNKYDIPIHPLLKAMETGTDYFEKSNISIKSPKEERNEIHEERLKKYLNLDKQ